MRLNKKATVIAASATAGVMLGAGIGLAYWSDSGSGSGSASVGSTTANVTVTATNGSADLVPGGDAASLTLVADNPNTYSVSLDGDTLSLTHVYCGTDDADMNNNTEVTSDSWFSLSKNTIHSGTVVGPKSGSDDGSATLTTTDGQDDVQIQMADDTVNSQDVCKGNNVYFTFSVDAAS